MGTIFVAYGDPGHRDVLEFAVEQAAACGHDLHVYHVQEDETESAEAIREEIERVVGNTAPGAAFEVVIDAREEFSDRTNVSKQKRLTAAILDADREYEYVVMGDVERDSLEEFAHASMTKAVLETHAVPVLLVPV